MTRRATHFLVIHVLVATGCRPIDPIEQAPPDDISSFAVQAALLVIDDSRTHELESEVGRILRSMGCTCEGQATLANGKPAGSLYHDLPYLMLSTSPQRDGQIDVALFYHRDKPEELQDWIDRFHSEVEKASGLRIDVYEAVSTGPF